MKIALLLPLLALVPLASCSKEKAEAAPKTELAALGIPNVMIVEPELASSGQPSEAQFAELPAAGVTTVVCLRPADEQGTGWEEAKAKELGLRFVRIPVAGAEGLNEENAHALDQALAASKGGKTLVCCGSGNRVGGLLALRAYYVKGMTPEDALAYGKRGGLTKAEATVRDTLGLAKQE